MTSALELINSCRKEFSVWLDIAQSRITKCNHYAMQYNTTHDPEHLVNAQYWAKQTEHAVHQLQECASKILSVEESM